MRSHLCDVVEHFHALLIKPITPSLFDRWDPSFLLFLHHPHFFLSHLYFYSPPPYSNSLICSSYPHFYYIIIFHFIAWICIIYSPSYLFFILSLNLSFAPTLLHYLPSLSLQPSLPPLTWASFPFTSQVLFLSFSEYLCSPTSFRFFAYFQLSSLHCSNSACLCTAGTPLISLTSLLSLPAPPV